MLRLTGRVYLNADRTKVVPGDSPEASFLLGTKGTLISEADAKRLGVSDTENADPVEPGAVVRSQIAVVPRAADDEELYDDQTERGKAARRAAREQANVVRETAISLGASEAEADQSAAEASGAAAITPPTKAEQDRENRALRSDKG